ncbi:MAG: pilus assembly protein N-terminal domain-containing protein [Alphaproteobacteria bacterium]|nr:pilus assembly protein N-terminal domain-containing protein [Alphaproteobacteria bacterium]
MTGTLHKNILSFIAAAFAAFALSMTAAEAAATKTVQLTVGGASTINLGAPVADVFVANPLVADIGQLRSDRLYVVGRSIGSTNLLAFDDQGNQLADVKVHVRMDETNLRETIKSFFPGEDIDVRTVANNIILTGMVSTPAVANRVRDMASRFTAVGEPTGAAQNGERLQIVDLMKVRGEQQVMLKVKIIEAKRAVLREYGIDTDANVAGILVGATGGDTGYGTIGGTGLQSLAPFGTGQILIEKGGVIPPINVAIQGLERDGLVNTLAEPNLTAISGETAGFLAGGEFPVPTGRDQNGNITLEFRQFGVALNFTPTVMASDRISLQLSTEVSARSDDDGVIIVNTRVPGLTVRRADTTVQMGSGGTLMIAGLIKSDDVHALNGFPGLQDVPVLGELFKSRSFARNESELIILVTPYLVEPYAQKNAEVVETSSRAAPAPVLTVPPATPTEAPKAPVKQVVPDTLEEQKAAPRYPRGKRPRTAGGRTASLSAPKAVHWERETKAAAALEPALGLATPAPVTQVEPPVKKVVASKKPAPVKVAKVKPVIAQKPAPAVAVPVAAPERVAAADPLAHSFVAGLRHVYGSRVPQTDGAGHGYIVD